SGSLSDLGDQIISMIVRLAPSTRWPSVLFVSRSKDDFSSITHMAAKWTMRVPAVPIAVAVPLTGWDGFLATAPESRTKALLREGELAVRVIDAATVEHTLNDAGAIGSAAAALAANWADAALLESAVVAVRATAVPPTTQAEDDRARSTAEHFLFQFLE